MSSGPLVIIGDTLLDREVRGSVDRVCPDAPVPVIDVSDDHARPGGAGLAAALAARDAADAAPTVLITALADDRAGAELGDLLRAAGIEVIATTLGGSTPEKVRIRAAGQSLLRIDRGGPAGPPGPLSRMAEEAIGDAGAILASDYGRGMLASAGVRAAIAHALPRTPVVWDPHPKGSDPVPGIRLATPNQAEASVLSGLAGHGIADAAAQASLLARKWRAAGVAVTLGGRGALVCGPDDSPLVVPALEVTGDVCGAGDRFACAATTALKNGALVTEAVEEAVQRASAYVADGGPDLTGTRMAPGNDAYALAARVRADGGACVVTGGCFDLLHAGHVGMLQAARRLGDCLIVCLNSDSSVRRLKGPDRPIQRQQDRAEVLLALECVDAVVVFDDDTPVPVLERLRPTLFVKGADYAAADLPEATVVAAWGGRAVTLPYREGRSTTQILKEVAHGAR